MKFDPNTPAKYRIQILSARGDPLKTFVLGDTQLRMEEIQEKNFQIFIKEARKLKLNYVYFGKWDLAGCENTYHKSWPAIWGLAEVLGIRGGCGNNDQYQINGWREGVVATGEDYIGHRVGKAWDINEVRELTLDEQFNKKFSYAAERDLIRKLYYATYEHTPVPGRPSFPG